MPTVFKTIVVWFKSGKFNQGSRIINERDFDPSLHMVWADYQAQKEKITIPVTEPQKKIKPRTLKTKTISKEKTVEEPTDNDSGSTFKRG